MFFSILLAHQLVLLMKATCLVTPGGYTILSPVHSSDLLVLVLNIQLQMLRLILGAKRLGVKVPR
jgi:hypothetical protein